MSSDMIQIQVLESIAREAARDIRQIIGVQDLDASTTEALEAVANRLQSAPSNAARYAHRYEHATEDTIRQQNGIHA